MVKLGDIFFCTSIRLSGNHSTDTKQVTNPKKPAIMNHYFLEGHNATYNDFIIFIPKNNGFKSQFESLLVKRDKSKLNRNIYTHPTELLHNHISYYNVYICIVNVIALLIPCFYEGFDNSSSV